MDLFGVILKKILIEESHENLSKNIQIVKCVCIMHEITMRMEIKMRPMSKF